MVQRNIVKEVLFVQIVDYVKIVKKENQKMNWKTYKSLTKAQKDEYDYKFKLLPRLNSAFYIMTIIILSTVIWGNIFLGYIVYTSTNPAFAPLKDDMLILLMNVSQLTKTCFIILAVGMLFDLIKVLHYTFTKGRWLKDNKVEEKKDSILEGAREWLK